MKKFYNTPSAELISIISCDVITTSSISRVEGDIGMEAEISDFIKIQF